MTTTTATKAQAKFGDGSGAIVIGGILTVKGWQSEERPQHGKPRIPTGR
ncbi:MAG TPA: hypothetical protein VKF81_11690 [Blastocatellia bacterium]|nr:hypothetical protein [Blastocatellia bacterium]